MDRSSIPCKYYSTTGRCFYGTECAYSHGSPSSPKYADDSVGAPMVLPGTTPTDPIAPPMPTDSRPCRNVLQTGACTDSMCAFNHELAARMFQEQHLTTSVMPPKPQMMSRGQPPQAPSVQPNTNTGAGRGKNIHMGGHARAGIKLGAGADVEHLRQGQAMNEQSQRGGTMYFGAVPTPPRQAAAAARPKMSGAGRGTRAVDGPPIESFGLPPSVLESLERESALRAAVSDEVQVGPYFSLKSLGDNDPARAQERTVRVFPWSSSVFKAQSAVDGSIVALRRPDAYLMTSEYALQAKVPWISLPPHPNIVSLKDIITVRSFGTVAKTYTFVSEYFPQAQTLETLHFSLNSHPVSEDRLWRYVVQILSALRHIHRAGLACRCVEPSKIIIGSRDRLRLCGVGVLDVVLFGEETGKSVQQMQNEDLFSLGGIILSLACRNGAAVQNPQRSLEILNEHYSTELRSLVIALMTVPTTQPNYPSASDVLRAPSVAPHVTALLDATGLGDDLLWTALGVEAGADRLLKLLVKLGTINERPEFAGDPDWSETGDRYLLKLFRDYVFHQVDSNGKPVVDYAHIVGCLNKLDHGVDERVTLMSRDEKNLLVVSYRDLKQCISTAFVELLGIE